MGFYERAKQKHLELVKWLSSNKSRNIDDELKEQLFQQSLKMMEQARRTDQLIKKSQQLLKKIEEENNAN